MLAGGASQLTDYIDYADPVAYYASDNNSRLESIASKDQYHYGDVKYIGSPLNANGLKNVISDNMNAFNSQLTIWRESQGNNARAMSEAYEISALVEFVSANSFISTLWRITHPISVFPIRILPLRRRSAISLTFSQYHASRS